MRRFVLTYQRAGHSMDIEGVEFSSLLDKPVVLELYPDDEHASPPVFRNVAHMEFDLNEFGETSIKWPDEEEPMTEDITSTVKGKTREHLYRAQSLSDRAADGITSFVGSWLFVGIHSLWFLLWISLRVEAFPYGLLTMIVSLEAIFLSTFVMISQNRQGSKDHARDDLEASEVDDLHKMQTDLYAINQQQLEILQLLRKQESEKVSQ